MKKLPIILSFQFLLLITAYAHKVPVKWGKVTMDELQLKEYSNDLQAPAVVLCDYGTAEVGARTEYTRHIRIKVFKNAGIKYGTVEVPYQSYNRYEQIMQINAQTFNLNEKGEIVKTKLHSGDFKEAVIDNRHKKIVFSLPDVKPGSVIEYRYTIRSLDLVRLENWYFQSTIPTILSEYVVSIPRRFNYLVTFQKGKALDVEEQKAYAEKIQWLYSSKIKKAKRELSSNDYLLYGSPKSTVKVYLSYGETMYFKMRDLPALKPTPDMLTFTDYYPVVKVHLYYMDRGDYIPFYYRTILDAARTDYESWDRTRLYYDTPSGYILYWLPTWDEFNQKWLKDERIGGRLIKAFDYTSVMDTVFEAGGPGYKVMEAICKSVKANVSWNGIYSMYASNELDKIIKRKTGTSGEINMLLIAALRKAGFDVDPVLIRTRNLGRIENMYPVHEQFNHVIAQVTIDGGIFYIDACNDSESFTKLPWTIENADGWLLKKEHYGWIQVKNQPHYVAAISKQLKEMR